jgi:hypothetical protein
LIDFDLKKLLYKQYNNMPLTHETVKTTHRVGQPPTSKTNRFFTYPIQDASKDLLRETARFEGMVGYSNRSSAELLEYLQGLNPPVRELKFQIVKQ